MVNRSQDPVCRPLAGVEAELHVQAEEGSHTELLKLMLNRIGKRTPYVPFRTASSGLMTLAGDRWSIDGTFLEYSSCECSTPFELIVRLKHAERLARDVAREAAGKLGLAPDSVKVYRANVDATGTRFAGTHLNLAQFARLNPLANECLIPFLIAVRCLCGTGSLGPLGYLKSAKGPAINRLQTMNPRSDRGIVEPPRQSYASVDFSRLHIASLDGPINDFSRALFFGISMLVAAVWDQCGVIGAAFVLKDPVDAVRAIDRSPFGDVELEPVTGDFVTAIEILEHFLAASRRLISLIPSPPTWTLPVLDWWRQSLDDLQNKNFERLQGRLDYWVKKVAIEQAIEPHGVHLKTLEHWAPMCWVAEQRLDPHQTVSRDAIRRVSTAAELDRFEHTVQRIGLDWSEFKPVWRAWQAARTADVEYHLVGDTHMQADIADAELARKIEILETLGIQQRPTPGTRSVGRSEAICEARACGEKVIADWNMVKTEKRVARFDDPFDQKLSWTPLKATARRGRR